MITHHDEPFVGNEDYIVAYHEELTGKTRLSSSWWGKTIIQFEVLEIVTVDLDLSRHGMDLHQHVQKTKWIRP